MSARPAASKGDSAGAVLCVVTTGKWNKTLACLLLVGLMLTLHCSQDVGGIITPHYHLQRGDKAQRGASLSGVVDQEMNPSRAGCPGPQGGSGHPEAQGQGGSPGSSQPETAGPSTASLLCLGGGAPTQPAHMASSSS